MEEYIKNNCENCKNKDLNLCHIVKNIDGKWQCVYKKE